MDNKLNVEDMAIFCKKKGFIFQAAEIYGGLSGFFDFGPLGVELKNNLKNFYWSEFVHKRDEIVGQDGSIITNPKVWKASGHVDNFADLVLTTKKSKTKIRADHFIEDELNIAADGMNAQQINDLIKKHELKYNGEDFEEVKDFNLMFNTQVGPSEESSAKAYLRPETCQSIFPNFKAIMDTSRQKLPFGIVQIGKAFRNEISPRDFIFRCREFEQIEMEYFYNPNTNCQELNDDLLNLKFQFLSAEVQDEEKSDMVEITLKELLDKNKLNSYHAYWLGTFFKFFNDKIGLSYENLRIREHVKTELSHYSSATLDIDYKFSFGFKEMFGLANRGNFDLTQHEKHSKSKLQYFDEETKEKITPSVIEPSLGVERFFFAVLNEAYEDDKDRGNIVLKLNPKLAPRPVSVFPLMKKPELIEVAKEIKDNLLDLDIPVFMDLVGSIGKRYAREDEIGTPLGITIDYGTIEDGPNKDTVTIRDRNSSKQIRISKDKLVDEILKVYKKQDYSSFN